ncbi:MAG: UDP-3-O-(3-hydroxymyristoyl)glucosamine N-acyltransferase [Pseudohongiellaceae bacterium]
MSTSESGYTLAELAHLLGTGYRGDPSRRLSRLATLKSAGQGDLSFLGNPRYARQLRSCKASAVIVDAASAEGAPCDCLIADDPYLTYARASQLFALLDDGELFDTDQPEGSGTGYSVHPTAVVSDQAVLGAGAVVGACSVIGPRVAIGSGVRVGANCVIGADTRIGADSRLYPGVTLYHRVSIGERAVIHGGAVIGADGFGFAFDGRRSVKIAQLGGVRIGDDVEIGAGTTVDRGALDDTVIGDGVKIDNQVQIAHNCVVGEGSIICGCSALAGSTTLGRYCVIGGGVGIIGHLEITDGVTVSAMSFVSRSIKRPGVYSSGTLLQETREWKKNSLRLQNLDTLSKRVRELESRLEALDGPRSGPAD